MTNSIGIADNRSSTASLMNQLGELEDLSHLKVVLSQFDCNLIVFGYGAMPRNESEQFKKLCDSTNEGKFLMSPNDD